MKIWVYSSIDSSVLGYSLDSNDVSTEAEESPLLRAVTKQRLVKTLQAGKGFKGAAIICNVEISDSAVKCL
jgi:hypothetical protein